MKNYIGEPVIFKALEIIGLTQIANYLGSGNMETGITILLISATIIGMLMGWYLNKAIKESKGEKTK